MDFQITKLEENNMVKKNKNGQKIVAIAKWVSKTLIGAGISVSAITGALVIPSVSPGVMAFAGWVALIGIAIDAGSDVMEAM